MSTAGVPRIAWLAFALAALAIGVQAAPQQVVPIPAVAAPQSAQVSQGPVQPPSTPAEGETVHVLVGKSVVINVQSPLTRVLSSNPTAVETLATSATEVVVEGKAAGDSSLILWDESGRSQVLDVVVDLDIAGLRVAIQRSYPHENLGVEADAGRLVLTGTASNAHVVEDLSKMAGGYSTQVVNSVRIPIAHDR